MPIGDFLQKMRGGKSSDEEPKKTDDSSEEKPEEMSRSLMLTEDEKRAFKDAKPGQDLACEVHGTMESDGKFRVVSVSPVGGGESYGGADEQGMAQQVAQRVTPSVQISPS